MKNKIILLVSAFCVFASCKGTWLMYDTEQIDKVYFKEAYQTHTTSFALLVEDNIDYTTTVYLMGMPQDYDREIDFEVIGVEEGDTLNTGTVTYPVVAGVLGEDFDVENLIIPAGEVSNTVTVRLHRTEKMLDSCFVRVGIRLRANENFEPLACDSTKTLAIISPEFYVYVNDGEPSCPTWWKYSNSTKYPLGWSPYLGNFFPEKYRRMLQYFHETEETLPVLYNYMVETMGYGENLENAEIQFFTKMSYRSAWAKYVMGPLYNYYLEYFNENPDDPNWELIGTEHVNINSFVGWGDPLSGTYALYN